MPLHNSLGDRESNPGTGIVVTRVQALDDHEDPFEFASNTSRTLCASAAGVNGFWR